MVHLLVPSHRKLVLIVNYSPTDHTPTASGRRPSSGDYVTLWEPGLGKDTVRNRNDEDSLVDSPCVFPTSFRRPVPRDSTLVLSSSETEPRCKRPTPENRRGEKVYTQRSTTHLC